MINNKLVIGKAEIPHFLANEVVNEIFPGKRKILE
jgi:hypothetical protein